MNREEIKKAVADAVVSFARSEAEAAIKAIDLDDLQQLVEAQMKNLTDPLETEICTGQRILDTKSQKLDVKKINK